MISLDQTDVNPQNNTVSASTSVEREADITIKVVESRDPVLAGYSESGSPGNLTHVITATNNGPSDASNLAIQLESSFPPGTTIVGFGPDGEPLPPVWLIANLPRESTALLKSNTFTERPKDVVHVLVGCNPSKG